jgi:hypothetical protein
MAYKLSERLNQNKPSPSHEDSVDLGKIATIFITFGIFSLITAWIFSTETERLFDNIVRAQPHFNIYNQQKGAGEQENSKDIATIGPIKIQKYKEVYEITIASSLPENSWAFIEGEVLDARKNYLFSFGKELWHETGYDDEGAWRESDNSYSMKITFPNPGEYYLNLKKEGSYNPIEPSEVQVTISKKLGSSIPHMVFGILSLLLGIILNEMRNKTIAKITGRMSND